MALNLELNLEPNVELNLALNVEINLVQEITSNLAPSHEIMPMFIKTTKKITRKEN